MNLDRKPLPRFWYLPRGEKAAVVMTGDDHGNGGTAGRFDSYKADSPPGCSVANWECVRATSYIYPEHPDHDSPGGRLPGAGLRDRACTPDTNCERLDDQAELETFYTSQLAEFAGQLPEPRRRR